MAYGRTGSMKTTPGNRQQVIDILLEGVNQLRDAGCLAYIVGEGEPDEIVIFEAWLSPEHHAASLHLPAVRDAISRAMPMLTGEFSSRELTVAGGLGLIEPPGR